MKTVALDSQRTKEASEGKEEGPEALQVTATFPFSSPGLGGSPVSSWRLGKARERVA
jgi:hypothetical protein